MEEEKKQRKFKFPLWAKTLVVLFLSVSVVSVVAVVYSSNYLRQTTRQHYINKSIEIADTLGIYLDYDDVYAVKEKTQQIYHQLEEDGVEFVSNESWGEDNWETYIHHFDAVVAMPEYVRVLSQIETFHAVNDALYTYVAYADLQNKRLVYLVDDSPLGEPGDPDDPKGYGERCLPGSFDDFTPHDLTCLNTLEKTGFTPEISRMEPYGYLASVGRPVFDPALPKDQRTKENIQYFSLTDLSMNSIIADENSSIRTLALILIILGVVSVVVGYLLVVFFLLRPVRKLTRAANEYTQGTEVNSEGLDKFAKVNIKTRDEIEELSNSMKKMEEDINKYIADLLSTHTKLEGAEKKADEMKSLADRDALTGILNKRAYFEAEERLNAEIKEGKAKFAISMIDLNDLKVTNDTLGHEKGDILIKKLSQMIKDIFKSSNMYRIGGDEFVVISENGDLKDIKKLEGEFVNKILESNKDTSENHLAVSAAIGVAIFDPKTDNNVEDAFKRADHKMYENKKLMKGGR